MAAPRRPLPAAGLPPAPAPSAAPPPQKEVVPFAVDDELAQRSHEAIAPLERELMRLSVQRYRLEAEYTRMPLSAGRTAE